MLHQSYPQAERAVPAQAAYLDDLNNAAGRVQRGTGRQLRREIICVSHLAVKPTINNNASIPRFAGIDGSRDHHPVGRDNNQPTTRRQRRDGDLPALSGEPDADAFSSLTTPPEDVVDMGVDYDGGTLVCSGGMRTPPV